jgi:DNA-binding LytR/AlgR family response regulator
MMRNSWKSKENGPKAPHKVLKIRTNGTWLVLCTFALSSYNMNIRCIIVDDEPLARLGMRLLVEKRTELTLIGEFENAIEAGKFLVENPNVDLMFLDVDMPGLTGLDFLRMLHVKPLTILATAFADYAMSAFELDVINYLMKPIQEDKFNKAIDKTIDLIQLIHNQQIAIAKPPPDDDFIFFKSERKYIKVFYHELGYVKGMKDYSILYTKDAKHITAMNIGVVQEQLRHDKFVRVSKSHLVNLDYILAIDQDGITLKGFEQETIPLGETYREELFNLYVRKNLVARK